jgi:hypothetical protein
MECHLFKFDSVPCPKYVTHERMRYCLQCGLLIGRRSNPYGHWSTPDFLSDKIGQTANNYHRPSMNYQVTNPEVRLGAATVASATAVDRNLLMRA